MQQRVSFQIRAKTLEEALVLLGDRYAINFTYLNNELPLSKQLTISLNNVPLSTALDTLLFQTTIRYYQIGSQVLLKLEETPLTVQEKTASASIISRRGIFKSKKDSLRMAAHYSKLVSESTNRKRRQHYQARPLVTGIGPAWKTRTHDTTTTGNDSTTHSKTAASVPDKSKRFVSHKPEHRWVTGFFVGTGYSFRTLSGNNDNDVSDRNKYEKRIPAYIAGISLEYFLADKISLKSGIGYLSFGEKGSYTVNKPYIPPPVSRVSGYTTDTTIGYRNNYHYLGIPLTAGYQIRRKNVTVSAHMGFIFAILLQQKSNTPQYALESYTRPVNYENNPDFRPPRDRYRYPWLYSREVVVTVPVYYYKDYLDKDIHVFRKTGLLYTASLDLGYALTPATTVFLTPVFHYFLHSIYKGSDSQNQKPYFWGIAMGAKVTLK